MTNRIIKKIESINNQRRFTKSVQSWARSHWSDKVTQSKVVKDYLALYQTKGLELDEYYDFEFEKRSEAFRKSFLGLNEQRHYLDVLNPIKHYSFARNKYAAHKMFESTGIRTSELYCYYEPYGSVSDSLDIATNVADVVRILKSKEVCQCVIKATEESHGDNVVVVKDISYLENDCELNLYNGKVERLSDVLSNRPRIFEAVIKQTSQLSSFNESSVNTIRFMTTLYPDGSARVIATFIKIGRAGKCVDNAGGGGNVDVCVDVETGEVKYAIQYDGWHCIKEIEKHPDSGVQLNGVIIDNWEAIKAEVIKFQQAFPWCKAAGWDIAITDEGPVVIEVNDFWDRTGQYFIRKGWRKEIRECYKAWKNEDYDWKIYRQKNHLPLSQLKKLENYE
ncbi:MAG: hypothetical protein MJZ94_01245 [Bacteroidales bacterium]|nr:hypothetical protein [Bacteroidales bacterium]